MNIVIEEFSEFYCQYGIVPFLSAFIWIVGGNLSIMIWWYFKYKNFKYILLSPILLITSRKSLNDFFWRGPGVLIFVILLSIVVAINLMFLGEQGHQLKGPCQEKTVLSTVT